MTGARLMRCGLWIQRQRDGQAGRAGRVGCPAAAETMAASQRRSQPISVVLGDDIE